MQPATSDTELPHASRHVRRRLGEKGHGAICHAPASHVDAHARLARLARGARVLALALSPTLTPSLTRTLTLTPTLTLSRTSTATLTRTLTPTLSLSL